MSKDAWQCLRGVTRSLLVRVVPTGKKVSAEKSVSLLSAKKCNQYFVLGHYGLDDLSSTLALNALATLTSPGWLVLANQAKDFLRAQRLVPRRTHVRDYDDAPLRRR